MLRWTRLTRMRVTKLSSIRLLLKSQAGQVVNLFVSSKRMLLAQVQMLELAVEGEEVDFLIGQC